VCRIVVIQGHPDPRPGLLRALADSYVAGAREAGHALRVIDVSTLDFPVLRARAEWEGAPAADVSDAQQAIADAQHVVIFFPLWLGSLPALLKAFFEQVFRPGFAVAKASGVNPWKQLLNGRSARIVVTMGTPALVFRLFFFAHGVKFIERNMLNFVGIRPVRTTLIGGVDGMGDAARARWHARMRSFGDRAR
jgi:putative NADPH-quinone reductase